MVKALTVQRPHASAIAAGQKTIEVRSRRIDYRGDLLIVAGKHVPRDPAHRHLPGGVALCLLRVADCRPITPEDAIAAQSPYQLGAWAWVLDTVRAVAP